MNDVGVPPAICEMNRKTPIAKKAIGTKIYSIFEDTPENSADSNHDIIFHFCATFKELAESTGISRPQESKKALIQDNDWVSMGRITPTTSNIPEKTALQCWNCTLEILFKPLGIPYKYTDGTTFHTFGCVCSTACMFKYNSDSKNPKKWEIASLIALMHKKIFPDIVLSSSPAPPKEVLKRYGGSLTDDEYREAVKSTTISKLDIILPPIIGVNIQCEKIDIDDNNTAKQLCEKDKVHIPLSSLRNQGSADKKLRIVRKKPLGDGKSTVLVKYVQAESGPSSLGSATPDHTE